MNERELLEHYRPWVRKVAAGMTLPTWAEELVQLWLPVVGYEGRYEVSGLGEVRSVERTIPIIGHSKQSQRTIPARLLRPAATRGGYRAVSLWSENCGKTQKIHLLVASAFFGLKVGEHPCYWCGLPLKWPGKRLLPDSLLIDHLDHDIEHNAVINLVPSCNPCNGHRLPGSDWAPWMPGSPIGRDRSHETCDDGHPWTPESTYVNPTTGRRSCRICRQTTKRIWDDARQRT